MTAAKTSEGTTSDGKEKLKLKYTSPPAPGAAAESLHQPVEPIRRLAASTAAPATAPDGHQPDDGAALSPIAPIMGLLPLMVVPVKIFPVTVLQLKSSQACSSGICDSACEKFTRKTFIAATAPMPTG